MSGSRWHPEELAALRSLYEVSSCRELREQLPGRSRSAIYQRVLRLGLKKNPYTHYDHHFLQELKRLNAQGFPDAWIADELRCERHMVSRHRRRLGLPSQRWSTLRREAASEQIQAMLSDNGVRNLAQLQQIGRRVQAFRRGWTPDCTPMMCEILDYLERGPGTRRGFCEVTGRRYHRCKAVQTTGGVGAFNALVKLGLVARICRIPFAPGQGKTCWQYRLADGVARRQSAASA